MIKVEDTKKRLALRFIEYIIRIFCLPLRIRPRACHSFKNILLVRLDHVGDVAMFTSIPHILKKNYPGSVITAMTGSWASDLLKYNPYVDNILLHDVPWWSSVRPGNKSSNWIKYIVSDFIPILKELRKNSFDLGIDFRGDLRQILLFLFLGGIRCKLSYDRSGGARLLNYAVPYDKSLHESQKNIRLLEILGIKENIQRPEIYISGKERSYAKKILESYNIKDSDTKIILSPGARVEVKRWPLKNFVGLGNVLVKRYNTKLIFTGISAEIDAKDVPVSENFINLIGKTSLLELTALFKKADLLISNDSGVTHIASSTNIPIITLFGPTHPAIYKPISDNTSIVKKYFSCSPCLHKKCDIYRTKYGKCMEEITIDDVMQKIGAIL